MKKRAAQTKKNNVAYVNVKNMRRPNISQPHLQMILLVHYGKFLRKLNDVRRQIENGKIAKRQL